MATVAASRAESAAGLLHRAATSAGIAELVDHILSIEAVGIYKPDPRVYQLAVDCLNVTPRQISLQLANGWDAAGAAVSDCEWCGSIAPGNRVNAYLLSRTLN